MRQDLANSEVKFLLAILGILAVTIALANLLMLAISLNKNLELVLV